MHLTLFETDFRAPCTRVATRLVAAFLLAASLVGGTEIQAADPAPSGTLQVPRGPSKEQPAKPPSAAPRQPVHQETGGAKPPVVVPPHGQLHPQKPSAAVSGASGKAVQPAPLPPVEAVTPPDAGKAQTPQPTADADKPETAAAKLPRFASLRSDDVNMRAGPGTRYRIDWVYKRRDLPVEIEREFDVWRWVRDADGIQGWVHGATLMGRRSFIVQKADATMRSDASESATAVAVLKPGVIGRIRSCEATSNWCNVQTGSYRGYLRRDQFWGALPGEAIAP
jgi:SH3-like domain-containing protein